VTKDELFIYLSMTFFFRLHLGALDLLAPKSSDTPKCQWFRIRRWSLDCDVSGSGRSNGMPSGLWHLDMDPRANREPASRFRICLLLIIRNSWLTFLWSIIQLADSRCQVCVAFVDRRRLVVEQIREPNKSQLLLVQYLHHLIDKHTGNSFCVLILLTYVLC
jgi:hypothetical protein